MESAIITLCMFKSLDKYHHLHFVGIGGSGLSGLALMLKESGYSISGSDQKESSFQDGMSLNGIDVIIGHAAVNIPVKTDLVIYSSAIPAENPERLAATARRIPALSYSEAVGLLTKERETVCFCGTHGKTTSTAMAATAFTAVKSDPCVIVGAQVPALDGQNHRLGYGKHLLLESCEHFRNFLNYAPSHVVVSNIDLDHLDYYKDLEDYIGAFSEFFSKIPAGGLLVANGDDPNVHRAVLGLKTVRLILYGQGSVNHYRISGKDILYKGKKIFSLDLQIPGTHNIYNATSVFALCHELGLDMFSCGNALNAYAGSGRRFEIKGNIGETTVIDDYAHHPVEISATLKSVREKYGPSKKVLCIFQPHQYSRSRHLIEGFAVSFRDADEVIIADILKVRDSEEDLKNINPESFAAKISKNHPGARYGGSIDNVISGIKPSSQDYDVIVTMGAGDVWKVADALVKG